MPYNINELMLAIEKNNMKPFYAETKEDAYKIVESLIPEGATVTHGGSETIRECGILPLLKSGKYNYLDRSAATTPEAIADIYAQSFSADVYLASANAITKDGVLYNVDGNSNRVAAIAFGPKSVICVVGINKVVDTLQDAVERVRAVAAPKNTLRLNCPTYCKEKGHCVKGPDAPMGEGCNSPARICCNFLVSAQQRHKDRIKVIIVNEELGY